MTEPDIALLQIFRDETTERLDRIVDCLLLVESQATSDDAVDALFRDVHSIKGNAGMRGFEDVRTIAHAMEDLLEHARRQGQLTAGLADPLLRATDAVRRSIAGESGVVESIVGDLRLLGPELDAVGADAAARGMTGSMPPPRAASMRVSTDKVDALLDAAGETVLHRRRLEHLLSRTAPDSSLDEEMDSGEQLLDELQEAVLQMRTLPLTSIASRLPRAVRDLARRAHKQVELVLSGTETQLDRLILDGISETIGHLLSNAVMHGIEAPADRLTAGKPAAGRVHLRAEQRGAMVAIEVSDDGSGVSAELVRRAQGGSLIGLLAEAGFWTATELSDVAGRGVGLDAAKTHVDRARPPRSSLGGSPQGGARAARARRPRPRAAATRALRRRPLRAGHRSPGTRSPGPRRRRSATTARTADASAADGALGDVLAAWRWSVLGYFLVVNSFYVALLIAAIADLRRHAHVLWEDIRERMLGSRLTPLISVLAPAYNEAATVAESVRALLTLRYPNLEVVLVSDGSPDSTLDVLQREFDLVAIHPIFRRQVDSAAVRGLYRSRIKPELVVVDKENGGKADALNAGLNVASGELICAIDADTLIEPDALLRMVRPFLESENVVAAGGTIRVANGCVVRAGRVLSPAAPRNPLAGVQAVEYLRAFLFGRLGWNRLGGNLIISGAFGLFRRDAMIGAGGYVHDTVGEDMELVASLRRRGIEHGTPSEVRFVPDPVAWTEVPESLRVLGRQRDRWHRGLTDVLWRHRRMIANPRYGALGLVVMPYFVVIELFGPVIESLGLLTLIVGLPLGIVNTSFAVLFFLVAYGYGLLLSTATLLLEDFGARRNERVRDRLLMLLWVVAESLGYRQLTVVWRLRGLLSYLRASTEWGSMTARALRPAKARRRARSRHTFCAHLLHSRLVALRASSDISSMGRTRTIRGRAIQGATPDWQPLLDAVGERLTGDFMWMVEVELATGTRLHAYKHYHTRRYVHLDHDGRAFAYESPGRYRPTDVAEVLALVFLPLRPDLYGVTEDQIERSWAAVDRLAVAPDVAGGRLPPSHTGRRTGMTTSIAQTPRLPLHGNVEIPQLGFGVFLVPPERTVEVVTHALEAGYRHIDTAAAYRNEAQVGQAIRAAGLARGDVFVTTKVFNDDHGHEQARQAFKRSLERLELDYVDLYLIHWPVPSRDRYVETWQALVELRNEGLIRAIGVSNFEPAHLQRIIAETGEVPAVNQVELHPYFQQVGLRREHDEHGIVTEAWSPLGRGTVLDDPAITALAERHGRTPAQVVIRWHLQVGNVVIPKSVTPARIEENADVFDFHLAEADLATIAELDRGGRIGPDPNTFVRP